MIIFLLLVIIAILLFGSSAVIGVVGAVLGFIALVFATFFGLAWIASLFSMTIEDMFLPAMLGLVMLCSVAWLVVWMIEERKKA